MALVARSSRCTSVSPEFLKRSKDLRERPRSSHARFSSGSPIQGERSGGGKGSFVMLLFEAATISEMRSNFPLTMARDCSTKRKSSGVLAVKHPAGPPGAAVAKRSAPQFPGERPEGLGRRAGLTK